ncbi:phosphoglucosamine mutase [Lachnoclostridium sp. Marseille-P6806]|uniref:phosphoglucosamine mutase n=1 Tax=Lachnoclostridium sp. Marseille-P6806 TaxID=2364793 RepID=UPI0010312BB3|nr:phosphoglucosamine mutase [Lachnoclostridium sp. Marseille-P6806]
MGRMFGTDGVRGVANRELTPQLAMELGRAGAYVLAKNDGGRRPVMLVGCDTRLSGDMLANALMAGACAVGADVVYLGVLPTPAVAYLARRHHADCGVVISASHNPMEFNGIKFFDGEGFKLPDATEDEIEALVRSGIPNEELPAGEGVGHITYDFGMWREYVQHAIDLVPVDLGGFRIVMDCAEGASFRTNVEAVRALGADLITLHVNPDGTNINRNCGSTHMEELAERVVAERADCGLAFDGDADRFLAVDEHGNIVNGDQIMAIVGKFMKRQGTLAQDTVVVTVMSNLGFYLCCDREGVRTEKTKVGDRYVLEKMKEDGYNLGGEQSGHVIFLGENTTGDGLLSALHLLQVMRETNRPLSRLASICEMMPQALINASVANDKKEHYMDFPEVAEACAKLEKEFAGAGRVLIRPSGTEPLVRVMIEGRDQELIAAKAQELADLIERVMA